MKETLMKLGFEHVTHELWKHSRSSIIITIPDDMDLEDLPSALLRIGAQEQNELIKATLNIKP